MKRGITTRPRALLFDKYIKLGYEKIYVVSQTYRDVKISYLVEIFLFSRDFVLMDPSEIILKTKKQVLFHISNQKRMKELFSKEDMNATEFQMGNNNNKYFQTCCEKISITYRKKYYIKHHYSLTQKIKKYIYPTSGQYVIDEYWPIRIFWRLKGRGIWFTFNRIAYKKNRSDQYNIIHNCSS